MNKFYITTTIYYVNDKPHIGSAYTTVAADVLARYHRQNGNDVFFLTGTDEHGAKIAAAADKAGKSPKDFVDEISAKFSFAWDQLGVAPNRFIRTTDDYHEKAVAIFLNKLKDSGKIYEGDYEGLYCVGHEAFIKESDLVDGLCPDHKTKPDNIKEKNWFFKLSEYQDVLEKKIENDEFLVMPESRKNEALAFIRQGLEDIAISRPNVKWGIPLPWDKDQTVYVWIEALFNYCSGVGYASNSEEFKKYWPADVHLIGKDILKFHCIIWPALLMAIGEQMPKKVFAHGFFTVNGEKISKSLGNAIDPNDMVSKYSADALRYFLIREISFGEDGDFSEERLRERYTSDLANGLGNLVQRVATLIDDKMDGEIIYHEKFLPDIEELNEIEDDTEINRAIESFKLHEALALIWKKIDIANAFINDEAPWKLASSNPEQFQKVMLALTEMIHHIVYNLEPFLPETTAKIRQVFGDTNPKEIQNDFHFVIKKGNVLFPRLP